MYFSMLPCPKGWSSLEFIWTKELPIDWAVQLLLQRFLYWAHILWTLKPAELCHIGFCQPLAVSAPKGGVWVHTQTLDEMPPIHESTGTSPSLMAGGCLLASGSRGQWNILPMNFISSLVLVRTRVSPYLALYKVSRAKPLPPRAYSVKKQAVRARARGQEKENTNEQRPPPAQRSVCSQKYRENTNSKFSCLSQALDFSLGYPT